MLSYNVLGVAKEFTKGLDLVTDRKVFQQTTNLAAIQSSSYTLTTNPLKEVDSTVHDEISKNYYTVRTNLRNQPLIEISLIAGSPPPEPSSHKDTNLPSYQAPEEVVREILISPSDCILPKNTTTNSEQPTTDKFNTISAALHSKIPFLSPTQSFGHSSSSLHIPISRSPVADSGITDHPPAAAVTSITPHHLCYYYQ